MTHPAVNDAVILVNARLFRAALDRVDPLVWQRVTVTNFPKGACGHASELLGRYLRDRLGVEPLYVVRDNDEPDGSWRGGHAWLELNGLTIDITGDQFGWEPVIVSRSSARHGEGQPNLRQALTADPQWWGLYAAPVYAAVEAIMARDAKGEYRMSNDDLEQFMRPPLKRMSDDEALESVGTLIDLATALSSEPAVTRSFEQLRSIERRDLTPANRAILHYYRANAWGAKRAVTAVPGPREWEQPNREKQIFELLCASYRKGFDDLDPVRQCQILTNLGIQLNEVGRFVEAIEIWDRALAILPNFAMALGSRGTGLKHYALASADRYALEILLLYAERSFMATTAPGTLWDAPYPPSIRRYFKQRGQEIADRLDLEAIARDFDPERTNLGRSGAERAYRAWCLKRRLFLNPLNDVVDAPVAAEDYLMLPPLTVSHDTSGMPPVIGLFNQMKQEFAFARLMLFESVSEGGEDRVHFADRRVRLFNTLDYPSYSMATEKMRTAFRLAYGLLDKVGYFINDYWNLGTPVHRVGFRSVWYTDGDLRLGLQDRFATYENWPLLGLFWLSKDLFEEKMQQATNPDARELFILRNHLEHKYLHITQGWASTNSAERSTGDLGITIGSDAFGAKALRLLKLARAAVIYLALAVHREERLKSDGREPTIVMQMPLTHFEDRWKR